MSAYDGIADSYMMKTMSVSLIVINAKISCTRENHGDCVSIISKLILTDGSTGSCDSAGITQGS